MKGTGPATDGACDVEDNHPECTGGPTPFNESYMVSHRASLTIAAPGVLGNDMPIPGDNSALTAILVQGPMNATSFSLNADGSFSYDPVDTFVGTDFFYYRVVQSGVESKSLGIVTITVTNIAPNAFPDSTFTMKNEPVTLNVLTNDTDADGDDLDISAITVSPTNGAITWDAQSGSVTYTPAAGYTGMDSFQYKAKDPFVDSPEAATVTIMIMGMLRLDGDAVANGSPTSGFDLEDVTLLERAAARQWVEAGADEEDVQERLAGLSIQIQDLPGDVLAAYAPGILVVDINGAGHDWFLDSTPADDSEFPLFTARTERQAVASSRAYGRVDLLTVLMHETGHLLGLEHSDKRHNVMTDRLPTGTRRFPSAEDVDLAILNGLGDEIERDRRRR
jgi:Bacterial Ig domain/Matrixin